MAVTTLALARLLLPMSAWMVLFIIAADALRLEKLGSRPHDSLDGAGLEAGAASSCVPLRNRHSHYTVRVTVGTPPRKLDLLADTGSDALIVNSCSCRESQVCGDEEKCFSPHRSSTFNQSHDFKGHAHKAVMTFGSGRIESRIGSDVVSVGNVSAQLTGGLYMLVDRKLNIDSKFEGILGLGPPHQAPPNGTLEFEPYGFLEAAGISRFSICLNRGKSGVMRLGTPPFEKKLGSIGRAHWGLRFDGVSVGDWHLGDICDSPGSCAALPDSGTTLITAPAEHLRILFSHICEHWPRCNETFQNNTLKTDHKWFHFERLLLDCHDWAGLRGGKLNETLINLELPHLRFTVTGEGGERQKLKLLAEDYILHMKSVTHLAATPHWLPRWMGGHVMPYEGKERNVCSPAFHPMNTTSTNMGQIWILGLPVLQKYQVSYDRSTRPPSMSFSSTPCDGCDEVRLHSTSGLSDERRQGLMWLDTPPRVPTFPVEEL
mmetsp:Transcript_114785/g.335669  ORF Transcript_114785/g.335669 Transcript_114785/m.335669 type:complete len:489 (+) Transcript_114785:59-1525(+)